jgi:hypothetical protein
MYGDLCVEGLSTNDKLQCWPVKDEQHGWTTKDELHCRPLGRVKPGKSRVRKDSVSL